MIVDAVSPENSADERKIRALNRIAEHLEGIAASLAQVAQWDISKIDGLGSSVPPGSQTEVRGKHPYTSTACQHAVHDRCRLSCKFCFSPCMCECHRQPAGGPRTPNLAAQPDSNPAFKERDA
jgi:hypothetical protein